MKLIRGGKTIMLDKREYTYYILLETSKFDYVEMFTENKQDDLEDILKIID